MFQHLAVRSRLLVRVQISAGVRIIRGRRFGLEPDLSLADGALVSIPYRVQNAIFNQLLDDDVAIGRPVAALPGFFFGDLAGLQLVVDLLQRIRPVEPRVWPGVRKVLRAKRG